LHNRKLLLTPKSVQANPELVSEFVQSSLFQLLLRFQKPIHTILELLKP
jgi:hypothetical protein